MGGGTTHMRFRSASVSGPSGGEADGLLSAKALNRFAIVAAVGSPLCILTRKEIADSEAGFLS